MSKADIAAYIKDDSKEKKEKDGNQSEMDTDMDRTMFNEFWTDLSEFKPKDKKLGDRNKSMSVSRGAAMETTAS